MVEAFQDRIRREGTEIIGDINRVAPRLDRQWASEAAALVERVALSRRGTLDAMSDNLKRDILGVVRQHDPRLAWLLGATSSQVTEQRERLGIPDLEIIATSAFDKNAAVAAAREVSRYHGSAVNIVLGSKHLEASEEALRHILAEENKQVVVTTLKYTKLNAINLDYVGYNS